MTKRVFKFALLAMFILAIGAPAFADAGNITIGSKSYSDGESCNIEVTAGRAQSITLTPVTTGKNFVLRAKGTSNTINSPSWIGIGSPGTYSETNVSTSTTLKIGSDAVAQTSNYEYDLVYTDGVGNDTTVTLSIKVSPSNTGETVPAIASLDLDLTSGDSKPDLVVVSYDVSTYDDSTVEIPDATGTEIIVSVDTKFAVTFQAASTDSGLEIDFDNRATLKSDYGLIWDSTNGYDKTTGVALATLSGKPTQAAKAVKFKVTAYNGTKNTSKTYSLKINGDSIAPTTWSEEKVLTLGETVYEGDIVVSLDSHGPITWTAKALPTGLSLKTDAEDSTIAYLTGTPTKEGKFRTTLTPKNTATSEKTGANETAKDRSLLITVEAAPAFPATTTLPTASIGSSYSQTFTYTGFNSELDDGNGTPYDIQPAGLDDFNIDINPTKQQITISSTKIEHYPEANSGIYEITINLSNDVDTASEVFSIPVTMTAPKINTTSLKTFSVGKETSAKIVATGTLPITWDAYISTNSLNTLANAGFTDIEDLSDLGLKLTVDGKSSSSPSDTGDESVKKSTSTIYLTTESGGPLYAVKDLEIVVTAGNVATDSSGKLTTTTLKFTSKASKPAFINKKDLTIKSVVDSDLPTIDVDSDDWAVKGVGPIVFTVAGAGDTLDIDIGDPSCDTGTTGKDSIWRALTLKGTMPSKATTVTVTATNPSTKDSVSKKLILTPITPVEITDPGTINATVGGKISTAVKATGSNIQWSFSNANKASDIHGMSTSEMNVSADILNKVYGIKIDKKSGTISSTKVKAYPVDSEGQLIARLVAEGDGGSQDSMDVTISLGTTAPKLTIAKPVDAILGQPYNKGKGTKITVTGTPNFKYTSSDLPAGFVFDSETSSGKTNYIKSTGPKSLTIVNGKVAAQTATITVTDPAGNEGSATVSLTVRDQTPTFPKKTVTIPGSLAGGGSVEIPVFFKTGTGYYKWSAKGSGVTAAFEDSETHAVSDTVNLTITAPATISKAATGTVTITAENAYDSTIKATATVKVKLVTTEEGVDPSQTDLAENNSSNIWGLAKNDSSVTASNSGYNTDLIADGILEESAGLAPVELAKAPAAAVEEVEEAVAEAAVEGTLTLGAERGAGSFTEAEKDALEGYIVAAILPEIEVTVDGQYELEVDLAEEVPAGAKLVYFAFPRNAEPDDDDEIVDFIDKDTGEYIETVPESHVVIVVPWFDAGVKYAPVIAVEAE